jgi:anaerobic magnesium-protoporphyrin IX monomethyl ester cyclase
VEIRKITCVQLGGEFPDLCYRVVMPDYGMPAIGTVLAEAGYDVKVYLEHVRPPDWSRLADSDLICFSTLTAGAGKTYRLADDVRRKLGIPTVIGGTHATYYPDDCLAHCDYVVFGEGDETIVELVKTLERGGDPADVAGIGFRGPEGVVRTAPRPGPHDFSTVPDFSLIEGYRRLGWLDVLTQRRVMWIPVQSSRGCHFKCTFCIVNTMFPDGYRKRDVESVIRDLKDKRRYGREMLFVDNDFAANRRETKVLLRRMIEEDLDLHLLAFARVEVARDDELLDLMYEAGIRLVYQGYESVKAETLDAYDKHQTLAQVEAAIDKLHAHELRIAGSFVLGADTDTPESIERTIAFVVEKELAMAYFFPIWGHYPEQLNGYRTIVPWYRSIFRGWEYCDGNFVTHFPRNMPPSKLQRLVMGAYRRVYSPWQALRAFRAGKSWVGRSRLGHRLLWSDIERGVRGHIGFLEELEDGLYDTDGRLIEDRLVARVAKDSRWTFQAGNHTVESLGVSPLELPIPRERNVTCPPPALLRHHSPEIVE